MIPERRNDIGAKILVSVFGGAVCILFSLFVHTVWSTSNESRAMATKNMVEIAEMRAHYQMISNDLAEIKSLLKRRIPE
jgi:hypothetical protein